MSDSPNVSLVRRLYEAQGNPAVIQEVMSKDIHYDISVGFPHGGKYDGLDSVLTDFFGPLFQHFENFGVDPSSVEYIEIGDRVIALGNYAGRTKDGRQVIARMTHVWTIKDGKLASFWQVGDTAQFVKAIGWVE
jgi:ketosteroid isomerase-like protein